MDPTESWQIVDQAEQSKSLSNQTSAYIEWRDSHAAKVTGYST